MIRETIGDDIVIYNADCREVLPSLPDGSVDGVITDPPYNVGFQYEGDKSGDRKADYSGWCESWFKELKRVCDGPILISCGVSNLGIWHNIEQPRWVMSWHKPAAMGRSPVGFNNWEPVLVYGKAPKNSCDVFEAQIRPDRDLDGHPCPKPLMWARKQMKMIQGKRVLDSFLGSGTTGIAAVGAGKQFIGIEKEPAYYATAHRRLTHAAGKSKDQLFGVLE